MIKPKDIIIIGGNAAGPAAAAKAKRTAPEADVIMFEAGNFISTGTCELPYVLSGEIKNYEEIVFYDSEKFEREKGVKVFTNHLVESIDRRNKKIIIRNLISRQVKEQKFDSLIITTGSHAKKIPALDYNLKNIFTLKSIADLLSIQKFIKNNAVKNILIIGAGYIGLETADAFKKLGFNVTILEKENFPMPSAEEESRRLILDVIEKNNVEFIGENGAKKFIRKDDKIISVNIAGRILEFDLIITSIGFEPNNDLALAAKLETVKSGGIKVDNKLRTSDSNIFAAGDNIEVVNKITNRNEYLPLATLAQKFGHIVGENAAGGNSFISPVVKNIAVKIFDKSFVMTGISSLEATAINFNYSSVEAIIPNLVKVMPGSQNVFGKIIYEKRSNLILGANFLGGNEVIGYGDIISSFINNKIKADELANINYNYTPPLSPFVNLLSVLGRKIKLGN